MFTIDESEQNLRADIRVLGIGGGGGNAIETMQKAGINGVKFIAVNTDAQALAASEVETKIQLGANLTKGLGAGANPEIGRRAAIESYEDIAKSLKGADMAFITAGMGGGTGTGGIPVVAEAAKEQGILTVGVVTYPFLFEGRKRRRQARKGIADLKSHVDTLIVIHNDKLLSLANDKTPLTETFKKTDDILLRAVKGIAELINVKGLINLDFADVKTVMLNKGLALMGVGIGEGRTRVADAISQAISSSLLENISIKGATGIIVNITGGSNLSLMDVNQAISLLTEEADPDAEIIVGAVIDDNKKDSLNLTVIATGFDENTAFLSEEKANKINWRNGTVIKKNQEELSLAEKENSKEQNIDCENPPTSIENRLPDDSSSLLKNKEDAAIRQNSNENEANPFESQEAINNEDAANNKREPEAIHKVTFSEEEASSAVQDLPETIHTQAPETQPIHKDTEESILPPPYDDNPSPALNLTETENSPKEEQQPSSAEIAKKNLTPREILLSKVKEYREKQRNFFKKIKPEEENIQMLMPFREEKNGEPMIEDESLLFETEMELPAEDI